MTNTQIILNNSIALMKAGVLRPTTEMMVLTYENENGEKIAEKMPVPEVIHTFAEWKRLGYQVKKGSKAKASFPIWKYCTRRNQESEENTDSDVNTESGRCYMNKAFWFTFDQVQPIQ